MRLILVVRAAAELDIFRGSCPSCRVRRNMMKLKECRLAATACTSDKCAASLVALPHCTLDSRGYAASRYRTIISARSRGSGLSKPAPLEMIDQQRECTIED